MENEPTSQRGNREIGGGQESARERGGDARRVLKVHPPLRVVVVVVVARLYV